MASQHKADTSLDDLGDESLDQLKLKHPRSLLQRRNAIHMNIGMDLSEADRPLSRSSDQDEDSENEEDPLPGSGEAPTSTLTVREALEGLFSGGHSNLVFVKRHVQGKSFRQRLAYLMYNHKIGSFLRFVAFLSCLASCLLYVAEAIVGDIVYERSIGYPLNQFCAEWNYTFTNYTQNYLNVILLDYKPYPLWALQLLLSISHLIGAVASLFIRQEIHGSLLHIRNFLRHIDRNLFLNFILGGWFLITLLYPPLLHNLFVPSFLYCWSAKYFLSYIIIIKSRVSFFKHSPLLLGTSIKLLLFVLCFVFTVICFLHHFEKLGCHMSFFDSYWLVIVTFTTVGYGDVYPTHWSTRIVVTICLGIAIVYLPPKIELLWESILRHRKLHTDYSKAPHSRHVVLIATDLKPLHLRDFLSEFYSDRDHSDTHCVVMVEKDLPESVKFLLNHPRWTQRVTVMLGSGHRLPDLARVKLRKADACFLRTSKHELSPKQADQHTIMVAWTIKFYAPRCKLFVHVMRPESKFHLSMADEVMCESELKLAILANNNICPGISTMSALLMHTFTHEGRHFKHPQYNLYEELSPCEIYDVLLSKSHYFHYFVGKNFLYTAVVAYRKFHVTLLGVRVEGSKEILLNPGVSHTMSDGDTCFYIGESKEEHHEFVREEPSKIQGGLWSTSAMVASLALQISGLRPEQLIRHEFTVGGSSKFATEHMSTNVNSLSCDSHVNISIEESELDQQLRAERVNFEHEAERGLKLLEFHCDREHHHNSRPTVKLNIVPKLSRHPYSTEGVKDGKKLVTEEDSNEYHLNRDNPVIQLESIDLELFEHHKHQKRQSKSSMHSDSHRGSLLKRSVSHFNPTHHSTGDNSKFKRFRSMSPAPASPTRTHFSDDKSSIISHTPSHVSQSSDSLVVLELDNFEEMEELEELEEGHVELLTENVSESDDVASLDDDMTTLNSYVKGAVSLPYCGCEPTQCHLTSTPRQPSEVKIQKDVCSDGVLDHCRQKAIIVYAETATTELFHFVVPLRNSSHSLNTMNPIILLVDNEPSDEFISWIAQLPMIYYYVGSISCVTDLLKAGVLKADYLVVLASSEVHPEELYEHLADSKNITAVHTIARLFPHLHITTEILYRFNIRFLYTTMYDKLALQKLRYLARKGDHLTYLFLPQFVSGKSFTSSMLDTLLYQAYNKPYIVQVFRQLLGCCQVDKSGFLWKYSLNEELLKLRTCGRLFQRLASTLSCIPLGIYRSVAVTKPQDVDIKGYTKKDLKQLRQYLKGQLETLGMESNLPEHSDNETQQFVLVNPPPDLELLSNDIILVLHPPVVESPFHVSGHECIDGYISSTTPTPSPLPLQHVTYLMGTSFESERSQSHSPPPPPLPSNPPPQESPEYQRTIVVDVEQHAFS